MKIQMFNEDCALDFIDSNENVCDNISDYNQTIAKQEGIAIENDYRDPLEPEDRWYDITLSNGRVLKCIHISWFKILSDDTN